MNWICSILGAYYKIGSDLFVVIYVIFNIYKNELAATIALSTLFFILIDLIRDDWIGWILASSRAVSFSNRGEAEPSTNRAGFYYLLNSCLPDLFRPTDLRATSSKNHRSKLHTSCTHRETVTTPKGHSELASNTNRIFTRK